MKDELPEGVKRYPAANQIITSPEFFQQFSQQCPVMANAFDMNLSSGECGPVMVGPIDTMSISGTVF